MTELAPIALFVYNRLAHTRRTVEALAANENASNSILYIFSDGAKSDDDLPLVEDVRSYLKNISGFKQVEIVQRSENYGLAKSIISGVTELCNKHGKAIVLEDDIETSPYFLRFMNEALTFYENNQDVMHISGCRYPVESFGNSDTFFLHLPLCWGWATWQSSWINFEKDINVMSKFDAGMIRRFDFDDSYNFWRQLERNKIGKLNTWFIFWYATVFLRGGLALFPARSLVRNTGFDGSGENCADSSNYDVILSSTPIQIESIPCEESRIGFEMHKQYFRKRKSSLMKRIVRKLLRILTLK